ncbi:MAG: Methionine--tRNA ligase [candidate division WS2 bacterium]|nr:Methionine--tRNA ligase [Candidatus Psychracetigena formicireducens]
MVHSGVIYFIIGNRDRVMFYITTPIYYVNARPHLGTTYTTVIADVMSRYHRLMGEDTFFLTGTDEHGINIQRVAENKNITPQQHCDELASAFQETWKKLHIQYDGFIRTSENRHIEVVQQVFDYLFKKGVLYKGVYNGWYCPRCESYYNLEELEEDNCPIHKSKVDYLEEETYFFSWSNYQEKLLEYYADRPHFVLPENRYREIISFVERGLKDISVSRTSVSWGIPVVSTPEHTVYVWLDALLNYLSAVGFNSDGNLFSTLWPPKVQVIGKDILRQHAAFWPAVLMALELPLPDHLMVHEFFLVTGSKMSKSGGNVFDPLVLIDELSKLTGVDPKISADALRYFLIKDGPEKNDSDFSFDSFINRFKVDLANDWGNLINRTFGLMLRLGLTRVPNPDGLYDSEFKTEVQKYIKLYHQSFAQLSPKEALNQISITLKFLNSYIDTHRPWSAEVKERDNCLYHILEGIRIVSLLMLPFMPVSSEIILRSLSYHMDTIDLKTETSVYKIIPDTPIFLNLPPIFPRPK